MKMDRPIRNEQHRERTLEHGFVVARELGRSGDAARGEECGYSIDEPRTRRALSENADVRFTGRGPRYEVRTESGSKYWVDVEEEACFCQECEQRRPDGGCKRLRRVELEVRARLVPAPDGTFGR